MWAQERVLVTGGRGFLGRHIVELLRQAGADPIPVGRNEANLVDLDETLALFRSIGATTVCLLYTSPSPRD